MESNDSLRVALAAIEGELATIEQRAADLREAAEALRRIGAASSNGSAPTQGTGGGSPNGDSEADDGFPRTTYVVASVLRSRERHAHTTRQVMDEAQRRGLLNPELKKPYGTVLEALKRLVDKESEYGFLRLEPAAGETRWVYLPPDGPQTYYMFTGDTEDPTGDERSLTR